MKIDYGNQQEIQQAKVQKEIHLRKAEAARLAKDNYRSLVDDAHVAVCFDLQKMMPTPNVTNSKTYYLRQLWSYNLNVHNLPSGTAHMHMWHEGQASRGCQETASCLLKFIKGLPTTVRHITAFSDNCGGQNKSHYIVKFWLYIVRKTQIETVDHRFLIIGHSYNECDRDFGLIELKNKRNARNLYVPDHWAELVATSSKKFITEQMQDDDFVNIQALSPFFRKSVQGIRDMQWLHFEKQSPFTLFYKTNAGDGVDLFETLEMKSTRAGRVSKLLPDLPVTTERPKLKYAKYANLLELLQFVPPIHHLFYKNLCHSNPAGNSNIQQLALNNNEEVDEPSNIYDTDGE